MKKPAIPWNNSHSSPYINTESTKIEEAYEITNLYRLRTSSRTCFQLLWSQQDDAEYVTWLILERHPIGGAGADTLAEEPLRFGCRREWLESSLAGRLIITHDSIDIGNILLVQRSDDQPGGPNLLQCDCPCHSFSFVFLLYLYSARWKVFQLVSLFSPGKPLTNSPLHERIKAIEGILLCRNINTL